MAKSRINETHRKTVACILNFADGKTMLEIEDIGTVDFYEMFKNFDGKLGKLSFVVSKEE